LAVGVLCFTAGILYTFGPVPISRLPLGEVFSGIFYGFFIPFLIVYINMPGGSLLTLEYDRILDKLIFSLTVKPIFALLLLSVIPVAVTADIMLANNICDVEKDIAVRRYTLPHFIGNKAITLFAVIYYATYAANIAMVVLGILHPVTLIALLTFPLVQKNINAFRKVQIKETTFGISIINFIVIMMANTAAIFIGGLFERWF
ncbi:MAG: UbiA family prenyltransferase, partial [Clostridia bacterium]|nr:UbiA family prenyltransferase [Clostridia bacterium]